jgi:hypothetical protein
MAAMPCHPTIPGFSTRRRGNGDVAPVLRRLSTGQSGQALAYFCWPWPSYVRAGPGPGQGRPWPYLYLEILLLNMKYVL